ncbi:MAG: hypothetical protein ABI425_04060 [Patescibacteria group bacterium]
MSRYLRLLLSGILVIGLLFSQTRPVQAGDVLGIHILHPSELDDVLSLLKTDKNKDHWEYVTIPYGLEDINRFNEWQSFFDKCKENKVIPIVRLITKPEGDTWAIPTTKDIIDLSKSLSALNWPTDERLIIVFNEPNHSKEWGGSVDPVRYADVLQFTSDWFRTDGKGFKILPAGLDLAAPNGSQTMEAFTFWKKALEYNPQIFDSLDDWNSHSYPNPAFSSSPTLSAQNSMRGFQHELEFLKKYSGKEWGVYITETGWAENSSTSRWLTQYYTYAEQHIWSDPHVKAVTPFLLHGAPGPFSAFSFLDQNGKKTRQFEAYRRVIETTEQ